ncbi:MAG TPA: hypothetical protein VFL98_00195 [Candidatus Paceibacterota bacterium]|nr:hypothetical protein [Candidatus Paceibacterota bacterium]
MPNRVRVRRSAPRRPLAEHGRVRLAQRRKRIRIILSCVAGVLVLALLCGAAYATHLPAFTIGAIEVTGAHEIAPSLIQKFVAQDLDDGHLHLLDPTDEFLYPKDRIEADMLAEFPRLATVTLSTAPLLHPTLTVHVTERQAVGLWCEGGLGASVSTSTQPAPCYYLDGTGDIYAAADEYAEYVIYEGGSPASATGTPVASRYLPGIFPGIGELVDALSHAGYDVRILDAESSTDYAVLLANGLLVKATFAQDPLDVVADLEAALSAQSIAGREDELQYLDLRFPGRAYYRFKGDAQ